LRERFCAKHSSELGVGLNRHAAVLTTVFLDVEFPLRQGGTVHVTQEAGEFFVVASNVATMVG
jgi:hypothetical protein